MAQLIPSRAAILRLLQGKLTDEWQRLGRRLPADLQHVPWPESLRLDEDGLGADSLDRLALASATAGMLCLADAGNEDRLLVERTLGGWADVVQEAWEERLERLVFQTSGSTGVPKACTHRHACLVEEMRAFSTLLDDRQRVVALVAPHHIYGFLFTVLLPEILGIPVLDMSRAGSMAQIASGDVVVGFPTRWEALLRAGFRFPPNVVGTTSTAPCDPAVIARLRAAGLSQMMEVYGSSETAGIGWRLSPDAPYQLLPHWRRTRDSGLERSGDVGPIRAVLADQLEWSGEGTFRVLRRVDGAVQVGGVNVFPEAIARRLEQHPKIEQAMVRLSTQDQRLKAFIVPRGERIDAEALMPELEDWIASRFQGADRPRSLTIGPALPRNDMGKLADW